MAVAAHIPITRAVVAPTLVAAHRAVAPVLEAGLVQRPTAAAVAHTVVVAAAVVLTAVVLTAVAPVAHAALAAVAAAAAAPTAAADQCPRGSPLRVTLRVRAPVPRADVEATRARPTAVVAAAVDLMATVVVAAVAAGLLRPRGAARMAQVVAMAGHHRRDAVVAQGVGSAPFRLVRVGKAKWQTARAD